MKKEKEVTLVEGEDGVFSAEEKPHLPHSNKRHKNAQQFFDGMDAGLDFLDGVQSRLTKLFGFNK